MKDILIEFNYTLDEAVFASIECAKCISRSIVFMPWIGGSLLFGCVIGNQIFGKEFLDMAHYIVIGIVFSAIPFTVKWSAKRNVRKSPSINRQIVWNINDIELNISEKGGETRFIWSQLIRICERKRGFLLFSQPKIAQWIPKHGFKNESEIALFRDMATNKSLFEKNNIISGKLIKNLILYLAIVSMLSIFYYLFNPPS